MTNPTERKSTNPLWNAVKIALAIFLLYFVVSKTNYEQLLQLKDNISWVWLGILLILFMVMTFLKAFQYHALIEKKGAYWSIFRITIWQNAISNFIATSAGIASYMTMLKTDEDVKVIRSGITFIITKFGDLFAILLTLSISSLVVWKMIVPLHLLTIVCIAAILVGFIIAFLSILWREKFVTYLASLVVWMRLDGIGFVKQIMGALDSLAKEERSAIFRLLRRGIFLSLLYMVATMLFAYTSLRVFNVSASIWAILYVGSLTQIVSFIPIQIFGGLGVAEVANVYLYGMLGMDEAVISGVMIGLRAIFYLMNGMIFLYLPIYSMIKAYRIRNVNKK